MTSHNVSAPAEPTLSVELIKYRLGIAERYGADISKILCNAEIDPVFLQNPINRVTMSQECSVWREIVASTGREDIGLLCGAVFPIQVTSVIGYVMMNAPTLLVAVEKLVMYQRLIGDSMGLIIRPKGEHTILEIELWTEWRDELRYTIDLFAAATQSWISSNSTLQTKPFRIGFIYPNTIGSTIYQTHFEPAPVDLNADSTYLAYSTESLNQPVLCANASMFEVFDRQANELIENFDNKNTLSWKVQKLIAENLNGASLTIEQTAKELAMSTRSLQNKLKEESTSYQEIVNRVRQDLAEKYIRQGIASLADIAFLLGYSEVSAFSRSFKKWTGISPSQFAENCKSSL